MRDYMRDYYMGGCQNYGPFLGPYYNRDPKRDHYFDNHPYGLLRGMRGV